MKQNLFLQKAFYLFIHPHIFRPSAAPGKVLAGLHGYKDVGNGEGGGKGRMNAIDPPQILASPLVLAP